MKNFHKIGEGVNVMALMHALTHKPHLWNQNNIRTTYPDTPHREVDDILLRFNDISQGAEAVANDKECFNYPAFAELPHIRPLVFDLMRAVEGEQLGRLMITRMAPGRQIYPHEDAGAPAEYYSRYHITLQGLPGALFRCGDEEVNMRTGDVWWFDNQKTHSVVNNSADNRITMIADIRVCP